MMDNVAADWVVAAAAVAALLLAAAQLHANNQLNRESHARQTWLEYLKIGLEYPQLGGSQTAMRELRIKKVSDLADGVTVEAERYLWFLTITLDACESVITYLPRKSWEITVEHQIDFHKPVLQEVWASGDDPWKRYYTRHLDRLVTKVLHHA